MITEIVLFRLPEGMSREDAIAKYRLSVPAWQANPDLIRKAFLFDETSRRGGGVYHWKNIEAAKVGHGPEFQKTNPIHLRMPTRVPIFRDAYRN
jgi:hypothetical protein